jgi:sugar/nucleoside kinase (ribokinase family)
VTGARTIDTAAKRVKRWFTGVLALKCGSRGSIIFAEGNPVYSKAFRIAPLDATGAGDVFDAAFLTGIIGGEGLKDAARRGNAAAAILMASAASDLSRFPTKAAVHKLLRKRS